MEQFVHHFLESMGKGVRDLKLVAILHDQFYGALIIHQFTDPVVVYNSGFIDPNEAMGQEAFQLF
jgi:hypothetical protein